MQAHGFDDGRPERHRQQDRASQFVQVVKGVFVDRFANAVTDVVQKRCSDQRVIDLRLLGQLSALQRVMQWRYDLRAMRREPCRFGRCNSVPTCSIRSIVPPVHGDGGNDRVRV